MKKIKYTVMDSSGNVQAAIIFQGGLYAQVGDYTSLPNGFCGTLIRAELVLDADVVLDTTKPV